jgi:hypothetical protein
MIGYSGWIFTFLDIVFLLPRTMTASALATVPPLQVVLFGKDDIAFRGEVIVFGIKFIRELHGFRCRLGISIGKERLIFANLCNSKGNSNDKKP